MVMIYGSTLWSLRYCFSSNLSIFIACSIGLMVDFFSVFMSFFLPLGSSDFHKMVNFNLFFLIFVFCSSLGFTISFLLSLDFIDLNFFFWGKPGPLNPINNVKEAMSKTIHLIRSFAHFTWHE